MSNTLRESSYMPLCLCLCMACTLLALLVFWCFWHHCFTLYKTSMLKTKTGNICNEQACKLVYWHIFRFCLHPWNPIICRCACPQTTVGLGRLKCDFQWCWCKRMIATIQNNRAGYFLRLTEYRLACRTFSFMHEKCMETAPTTDGFGYFWQHE